MREEFRFTQAIKSIAHFAQIFKMAKAPAKTSVKKDQSNINAKLQLVIKSGELRASGGGGARPA